MAQNVLSKLELALAAPDNDAALLTAQGFVGCALQLRAARCHVGPLPDAECQLICRCVAQTSKHWLILRFYYHFTTIILWLSCDCYY